MSRKGFPTQIPTTALAGMLRVDRCQLARQKQARRPPAKAKSTRCPLILLVENREPVRVALKNMLETSGYDLIVVEHASEALSIAAAYDGHIDFLIIQTILPGVNGGLLAHLFQCTHPETRTLFVSGSKEEVLICDGTFHLNTTILEQPVPMKVVAGTLGEMIAKRQGIGPKSGDA